MTTLTKRPEQASEASRDTSRASRDVVSVLSIYAVVRIVLPAEYVIGPLGAAGQPGLLVGLGITLLWLADWLGQPWSRSHVKQPLKRFALVFLVAVLVSYLVAAMRPFSPNEQLGADRALLNVIAWVGVMLAAMDGITTRARLDTLLRRVVMLGGLEGILGVLQMITKQSFIQYFRLPGFADNGVDVLLLPRGSFLRAQGTAVHPIEYGVTLAMLLPIALHYAVTDHGRRTFIARWFPVGAMALGLSQSVSRSAVVCTAVGLIVLLASWTPRLRHRAYLAAPAFIVVLAFARPGFIRTFFRLFSGVSTDPSILSRTESYGIAWSFIERAPVFGRGMGTFLAEYWILDNQFLGSLIEIGVVGVICMLLLFFSGIGTAWRLRATSGLGPALAAAIAAGGLSFAFFDAFAFPWVPSILFLALGCVGALRRLTLEDGAEYSGELSAATPAPTASSRPVRGGAGGIWSLAEAFRRRWPLAVAGIIAAFAGAYAAATVRGVYYEQATVVFIAPSIPVQAGRLQLESASLAPVAGVVARQMNDEGAMPLSPDATVITMGLRDGVWVRVPNQGGQWQPGFHEGELDVEAVGDNEKQAVASMAATVSKIRTIFREDQLSAGAPQDQLIQIGVIPPAPPVLYVRGSAARAGIAALALGLAFTSTLIVMIDRWRRKPD